MLPTRMFFTVPDVVTFLVPEELSDDTIRKQIEEGCALINVLNQAMGQPAFRSLTIFNHDKD